MASKTAWRVAAAYPIAALMLAAAMPTPARADFFDDVRRTVQTDIPHFFQDDVPCAFGGQPTSHTKSACHGADQRAKPVADKTTHAPRPIQANPQGTITRDPPEYP